MKELNIHNFKCFQDVSIPIKDLTIMAGANGNGKSSAIQALLFLRKTIEENCSLNQGYYVTEGADLNAQIALTEGYLLSLGNSSLVLNRQSNTGEIKIGISNNAAKIEAEYFADTTKSDLFLKAEKISANSSESQSLLKKEFYYLNAERIGPRVSRQIQFFNFPHTGYQGEYVAQLIASINYVIKIDDQRKHKDSKSPRLEAQLNAWLNDMMPGVNIRAVQSLETMTAQIKVENYYTKGEPVLATNIGFGISYMLPIIVTGLIAKKGSYMIVENPEAHLHPSAQSKIGQFLAVIAKSGVNVIVETHSDHILNGVQLSAARKQIDPQSIAVNFFNQDENSKQPIVEKININQKGELSKWPKGFFDQSQRDFAELFKIRKND